MDYTKARFHDNFESPWRSFNKAYKELVNNFEEMEEALADFKASPNYIDIVINQNLPDGDIISVDGPKSSFAFLHNIERKPRLLMNSKTAYSFFFKHFDFDVAFEACKRIAMSEVDKVIEKHSPANVEMMKKLRESNWKYAMLQPILKHEPDHFRSMYLHPLFC